MVTLETHEKPVIKWKLLQYLEEAHENDATPMTVIDPTRVASDSDVNVSLPHFQASRSF